MRITDWVWSGNGREKSRFLLFKYLIKYFRLIRRWSSIRYITHTFCRIQECIYISANSRSSSSPDARLDLVCVLWNGSAFNNVCSQLIFFFYFYIFFFIVCTEIAWFNVPAPASAAALLVGAVYPFTLISLWLPTFYVRVFKYWLALFINISLAVLRFALFVCLGLINK